MTDTLVRLRSGKLIFETMVDLDNAMKLKRGDDIDISEVIRDNSIYTDQKKGMKAGNSELEIAFNTTDFNEIVRKLILKGQVEVTKEFRDEKLENRRKQVVDFLVRNSIDSRTGRPFTPETIENALKEGGAKIEDKSVEKQMKGIVESLSKVVPIKIETKKIKIVVPAIHTGKIYGLIQDYKEKEEWLGNGDLQAVLNIPVGLQMDFYDKLNSETHGSVLTEEIREE